MAMNTDPSAFDDEECLRNDVFLPHVLTVASNSYSWHTSKLYLDTLGMGVNEIRVLSILYEYGELQAWKICDILWMNKSLASQSLKSLEKKGLITIEVRRGGRFASPTPSSLPVHRQIVRMARSREEILLQDFSGEERAQFLDYLKRLHRNIPDAVDYTRRHFAQFGASDETQDLPEG
ncbi:winged helix-turn-helix transcriptional regulator [Novosphingobium profundi]|nr:winged helix-turn-helix transcriptional regulator [Novosphingobium profundi]